MGMMTVFRMVVFVGKLRSIALLLVVFQFFSTPEALVMAGPEPLNAADVTAGVADILCRPPDFGEVERLRLTDSVERLRWDLRTSPEGARITDVRNAYLYVLGRDPLRVDCAGVRYWASAPLTGEQVRRALEATAEGQRVADVRGAFREVLERDPLNADNLALRYWVENGASLEVIKDALRSQRPLVGVYYFPWYLPGPAGWGNGGTAVSAGTPQPLLGWYTSSDTSVVRRHVEQIERTGFDFVILNVPVGQPVIWANVHTFFRTLEGTRLRAAVMLDDLYTASPETKAEWVSRVLSEFGRYPNYFRLDDSPLVPLYSAPLDFGEADAALRTIYWTKGYAQGANTFNDQGILQPQDWPFWSDTPQPLINGLVPVLPGYDDGHLGREKPMFLSRDGGQLYRTQWERALAQRPRFITVYSWNEHFEHTAIEPTDRWGNLYLDLTACYIARAKAGGTAPCP